MKLQDIKSEQDTVDFIEGCLNDFETGVSSKNETISNIVELIILTSKKARERLTESLMPKGHTISDLVDKAYGSKP